MSRTASRRKRPKSGSSGNRALKWVMIVGFTLLLVIFVAGFGLKLWFNSWLKSDEFREIVNNKIAETLKSETELDPFKWDGSSVYTNRFRANGYEDGLLSRLELDGLRATFGIADQLWQIPEANVNRLNLEFSKNRLPGKFRNRPAADVTDEESKGGGVPGWAQRFIPKGYNFGDIRVSATNLRVLNNAAAETFSMTSVESVLRPIPSSTGWQVDGRRGKLMITGQPEMDIDRFSLRWQGSELFITEAIVDIYENTRVTAGNSVVVFPEKGGPELKLHLTVADLDIARLIGPEWQTKLSGRVYSSIDLTGQTGAPEGLKQTGTFLVKDGLLKDLPILDKIVSYTKNPAFKRLTLSEATAEFERQGDRTIIRNLAVEAAGLTRLEGNLNIVGRAIDGQLRLGVTPGKLIAIPGAEQKVFVSPENGFLWTDVRVAGTLDDLREDLTSRLAVAAAEQLVEDVGNSAVKTATDAIQNPASAPGNVIDQGKKLIDTLVPLLK